MRSRLFAPALVAVTVAAAGTAASADTTTLPQASGCVTPRLIGMTERAALRTASAAGCVVHLTGARLKRATVQTIAAQAPAPGARSAGVRLTLNPLCFGSALAGPPHDEGMRPGPTELITGLYVVGGPALPYSTPRCRRKPGSPTTGMLEVRNAANGVLIASRTLSHAHLVTVRLAPGRYRVGGHVGGTVQHGPELFTAPFTIRAGFTTRRYVIEPVP
ncbi:MAG: hypothetical protein WAL22_22595 [Solirubrobacteraceae bacterium]